MIQIAAFLMARFPNVQACPMGMELGEMLEQVGFDENEIGKTLLFLQLLEEHEYAITQAINPQPHSMRIYHPDELKYLSDDVLDFLQFLQKEHLIQTGQREFIIYALMYLPEDDITLDVAKTLALLVLWAHNIEVPVFIQDELNVFITTTKFNAIN